MFSKNEFAILLKKAIGKRTINEFALHSDVSATYISKLLRELVNNPPGVEIIKKISSHAYNDVSYLDFMLAAGHLKYSDINDKTTFQSIEKITTEKFLFQQGITDEDTVKSIENIINLAKQAEHNAELSDEFIKKKLK